MHHERYIDEIPSRPTVDSGSALERNAMVLFAADL